jgi:ABC-type branched-subunit amino acid transport system substrate-binding protein
VSESTAPRPPLRLGACLSLSGAYARFGAQAASGLEAWRSLGSDVEVVVEDDRSDPVRLARAIRELAPRCDLMLGPYSTGLVRAAAGVVAELDRLLWNHGGAGDDAAASHPGHLVSVLTPASRYSEPFLRRLLDEPRRAPLRIVHGRGSFGRQVAGGAAVTARRLGLEVMEVGPAGDLRSEGPPAAWDLFSAGSFEEDVATISRARGLDQPPRLLCAVAAGVREFARWVANPDGIYGVGQWFPGSGGGAQLIGPAETDFLSAYSSLTGTVPDYPAVQAAAGAIVATHCARLAGAVTREALWSAAAGLDTATLFGGFRIDPTTGAQRKHEMVLVRWSSTGPRTITVT